MTTTPGTRAIPDGQSARITERQDQPEHLQRLLAYSHQYRVAQRWRRARATGSFALAGAGPILALFVPATSDLVAAISAGWLVLGRTVLTWLEQRSTLDAVRIQELYDTDLFHLPRNDALTGRKPSPEDIIAAARRIRNDAPYRNWYSIDLGDTPWPADVLLCQRQSAVWSRRDHRAYGTTVLTIGVAWLAVGLVVALARDLSLADYLIKIFLPSAPALLDSIRAWSCALAARHRTRAGRAQHRRSLAGEPSPAWELDRCRLSRDPGRHIPAAPRRSPRAELLLQSQEGGVRGQHQCGRILLTRRELAGDVDWYSRRGSVGPTLAKVSTCPR